MGGGKTRTSQTTTSKTPEQQNIASSLQGSFLPTATKPGEVFGGSRVAGMSGLQRNVIAGAGGFVPSFLPAPPVGQPLASETQAATRGILTGEAGARPLSPEQVNQFFSQAVGDPARDVFQRETIPGIQEAFAGPGFFGSARSQAEVQSREDLERELMAQRAGLQFDQLQRGQEFEESRAGRQLAGVQAGLQVGAEPARAVGRQLEIAGTQMAGLRDLFGFGEAEQTQEQREIFGEMERFAEEQGLRGQALDIVLSVLNQSIESTTTGTEQKPFFESTLGKAALGGIGGGLGVLFPPAGLAAGIGGGMMRGATAR